MRRKGSARQNLLLLKKIVLNQIRADKNAAPRPTCGSSAKGRLGMKIVV